MDDRQIGLSKYRISEAEDSLKVAKRCLEDGFYKDSINRSYYAAFYSIKSVLALGEVDFKRHKDVMAHFNKEYVATGIFSRELGKKVGRLQQLREKSDYDDFYIASKQQAFLQLESAQQLIGEVKKYLKKTLGYDLIK